MIAWNRQLLLAQFREKIRKGEPIIGGGAGTGISAKCEEVGGIDLIIIYNSGRFRMAGRGSLAGLMAYGNANDIMLDMAKEVLPVVKNTPVLAGVNGTDPFVMIPLLLEKIRHMGFAGVQNFPTIGLFDGLIRQNLEETGMSYQLEVEMIHTAHEMDMLTTPYVFSEGETEDMVRAGADIIVCHMGLTAKGKIGAKTARTLDESVEDINSWADIAKTIRDDVLILCHGGPIAQPEDAAYVLERCPGIHGFYGASSMERLPTEVAITKQIQRFKTLKLS